MPSWARSSLLIHHPQTLYVDKMAFTRYSEHKRIFLSNLSTCSDFFCPCSKSVPNQFLLHVTEARVAPWKTWTAHELLHPLKLHAVVGQVAPTRVAHRRSTRRELLHMNCSSLSHSTREQRDTLEINMAKVMLKSSSSKVSRTLKK